MKQHHVVLAALVLVALLIRLGFFLSSSHPYQNAGLVTEHGEVARNIVDNGKWFVINRNARRTGQLQQQRHKLIDPEDVDYRKADANPDYQREVLQTPGLALVLAAFWAVTGDEDYVYVQVLQILLDAGMVLLVYWCSLRLFARRRAALIAAAVYAVFLPLAALANIVHLDTWATYFTLGIFSLFLKARDAPQQLRWLVALGVATGAAAYFRPFLVLLPLALALATAIADGWERAWALGTVPLILALAFMAPWTIRNYVEFHKFIPMRIGVGQNLWEGLGELPNDFGAIQDDQKTAEQVSRERPGLRYGSPAYDSYLFKKGRRAVAEHPAFYAKVVARRVAIATLLLRNYNWLGQGDTPITYRRDTGGGRISFIVNRPWDAFKFGIAYLAEPLLFLIAVITAAVTWRGLWRRHILLLAVPATVILPYVLLHFEPRYALPGSFVYMILLGLGVDRTLAWSAERRAATH
jgi:4-amino-4-deoxy-L-arabinose transferase-like glycosyltransferase